MKAGPLLHQKGGSRHTAPVILSAATVGSAAEGSHMRCFDYAAVGGSAQHDGRMHMEVVLTT